MVLIVEREGRVAYKKFNIKHLSQRVNERYRNDNYKIHSNSIDYQTITDGESIVKEEQESNKTYHHV